MPHAAAGLGRHRKLLKSAQFKAVFNQRTSVHGKFFSVHVSQNSVSHPRLGLTVSKRVSKKAVERNRIKRQIRESFRTNQLLLASKDCVVVSKVGGAQRNNIELKKDLDNLWSRATRKCENGRQKL